jgi:TetR/AcrR family transcriptional repressor of nem operon
MRYGAEHKQKTRDKVIAEAARAIRAEGPHRVGVADVMAKAGLTHGGFYAHFASKDALVLAAMDKMFEDSRAKLKAELADLPPARGLSAYIDFYLSPEHRDARVWGCPMAALASDLPRLPGACQTLFGERVAALIEQMTPLLAALGRPEPADDASSMVAELVGALSLARAEPDQARSDAILDRSKRLLKRRLTLETLS